jgi:hypothetical protein
MRQIFVSYAQPDEEFAIRLVQSLRASGARVWLDVLDAEPGRNWSRSIEQALAQSHMMIVILTPDALDCAHVNVEWQAYLEAHRSVIPVLARSCDPPGPLRTRRPIDFTRNYDQAIHHLTTRLIEYGTRTGRSDPVIWTMAEDVHDFREERNPPPPPSPSANNPGEEGLVEGGLRRMVQGLRELLRGGSTA